MNAAAEGAPTLRSLLLLAVPALAIGVVSALVLWLVDRLAELLEHWIWDSVPETLGFASDSWWWILGVLTFTGLAVGLVVQFAPGHGGHDSATVELVAPVLRLGALPGVALVVILSLAGGVSLGPESPIIAITTAIAVSLIARLIPTVPIQLTMTIAAAGTIGAMFGTPVAAALVFTGLLAAAKAGGTLWDRMFLPLTAAGAGAITMMLLGGGSMSLGLPAYIPQALDLATGSLVAAAAAALAIGGVFALPVAHRLFRRLGHPVIYITVGGAVLGLLGIVGGPITLFKGLHQMRDLIELGDGIAPSQLVLVAVVKLVALVVAAAAGFRGGRIFPAVFIGVAVGMLGHALIPSLPLTMAVAAGVLGLVLVVGRDGWLALFMAVAVAGDIGTLPVLCIIVLPTWLIARSVPEMIVHPLPGAPATR